MKKLITSIYFILLLSYSYSQSWSALGTGMNNWVTALCGNDSTGLLYAGGYFTTAGSNTVNLLAQWDSNTWTSTGTGVDYGVHALSFIDGELYIGGEFLNANGSPATRIVKYDGTNWTALGSGLPGSVNAIIKYNNEIYAGFLDTGSTNAGIKKWTGSTWVIPGNGIGGTNPNVSCFKIYNNELYVGGTFSMAGGSPANGIAKWNGSTWSALGSGLNTYGFVYALEVYNNELYVGGTFSNAGGNSVNNLAKWNGSSWSDVGGGITGGVFGYDPSIFGLKTYNNNLYLTGNFTYAGGNATNYIAYWNGSSFSALGTGLNERGFTLTEFAGDLIVGGQFSSAGSINANDIAKWNFPLGVNEKDISNKIKLFPNPASDLITISAPSEKNISYQVFDSFGRLVSAGTLSGKQAQLPVSDFATGVYWLRIETEKGTGKISFIKG